MSHALYLLDELDSLLTSGKVDSTTCPHPLPEYLTLERVPISALYTKDDKTMEKIRRMFTKYGFLVIQNDIESKKELIQYAEEIGEKFFNNPNESVEEKK